MALYDTTALLDKLKTFLPPATIHHTARTTAFLERDVKLNVVLFTWTLILGWSVGTTRSMASLARTYERQSGCTYNRSSFYRRFDDSLLMMIRSLYHLLLIKMPKTSIGPFEHILALDATIIRLWDGLLHRFPSTQQGQAGCKLQLVFDVVDMSAHRLKLHESRAHEVSQWRSMGGWVGGRLLLMDLGYYSFWHFHNINAHGGYFLSRVKSGCAWKSLDDRTRSRGRRAKVCGLSVSEALGRLKGQGADWVVRVPVTLNSGRRITYKWRVLVDKNHDTGAYHTYVTNAPEELIMWYDARSLYALRWQVELVFKGLKSVGRLHHLPTRKPVIVEVLILASLLFLLLTGWLRHQLFGIQKVYHSGMLRSLMVMREWSEAMLDVVAQDCVCVEPECMLEMMRRQLADPNHLRCRACAVPRIVEYQQHFMS